MKFLRGFISGYAIVFALIFLIVLFILAIHHPQKEPVPARIQQMEQTRIAEHKWQEEEAVRQQWFHDMDEPNPCEGCDPGNPIKKDTKELQPGFH